MPSAVMACTATRRSCACASSVAASDLRRGHQRHRVVRAARGEELDDVEACLGVRVDRGLCPRRTTGRAVGPDSGCPAHCMRGPGKAPDAIRARSQRSTPSSPPRSRTEVTPARSVSSALRAASARRLSRSSVPLLVRVRRQVRVRVDEAGHAEERSEVELIACARGARRRADGGDLARRRRRCGRPRWRPRPDPTPRRSGPREWAHALADGGPPRRGACASSAQATTAVESRAATARRQPDFTPGRLLEDAGVGRGHAAIGGSAAFTLRARPFALVPFDFFEGLLVGLRSSSARRARTRASMALSVPSTWVRTTRSTAGRLNPFRRPD